MDDLFLPVEQPTVSDNLFAELEQPEISENRVDEYLDILSPPTATEVTQ